MTPPLLSVDNVRVGYDELLVLKGCSIEVSAGEFVALVGPNGAGKSTLLRAIAGLLPPRSGTIHLVATRIDGLPPYEIAARGIALVPERRRLFAEITVGENLDLGAFLPRAHSRLEDTRRLIFHLFPILEEKRSVPAGVLSGGEQQMLAVARGLMARPRLLMLDDPFLGLASAVISRFCEAIRSIMAEGTTILAAGQHVRRLLRLAHRAYFLDEGRVILSGRGTELLGSEQVRQALLELIPGASTSMG